MNAPHLPGLAFPTATPAAKTTTKATTKRPVRTFEVTTVLVLREVVAGRARSAHNADDPHGGALAVAMRDRDGWKVATAAGIVADRLTETKATALMKRVATDEVDRAAYRRLFGPTPAPSPATF